MLDTPEKWATWVKSLKDHPFIWATALTFGAIGGWNAANYLNKPKIIEVVKEDFAERLNNLSNEKIQCIADLDTARTAIQSQQSAIHQLQSQISAHGSASSQLQICEGERSRLAKQVEDSQVIYDPNIVLEINKPISLFSGQMFLNITECGKDYQGNPFVQIEGTVLTNGSRSFNVDETFGFQKGTRTFVGRVRTIDLKRRSAQISITELPYTR